MTSTPLELPLFKAASTDPNVAWLERLLDLDHGWMTAKQIAVASAGKLNDRDIRALAAANPDIISGQRGYRHITHATAEEADRAASWLQSQGDEMIRRSIAIRRRAHQLLG